MAQGIVGNALEDDPENSHKENGDQVRQRERNLQYLDQPDGHEGRDHDKLALSEVHDPNRIEDQDESQGD